MDKPKNFNVKTWENDHLVGSQDIDDPFIHTTIRVRGWRSAWRCLTGKLTFTVTVSGNHQAVYRAVMTADYTPDPERPIEAATDNCASGGVA